MWGKGSCSKDANEKLNARKSVGIKARLSKYTFVPYLKFGFYTTYFTLWEEECLEIAGLFKNFFEACQGNIFLYVPMFSPLSQSEYCLETTAN